MSLAPDLPQVETPIEPTRWLQIGSLVRQRGDQLFSWQCQGCWCWQALEQEACPRSWESCTSPWVAADGRLYYRPALLEALRPYGAVPATQSDLEYLAQSYRCWGLECLCRLEGDYSCVWWDEVRRRGLAARSPFGLRPLFYQVCGQALILASDPVWLFLATNGPRDLDADWVCWYLVTGHFRSASPWRTVHEVPPGGWVRWQADQLQTGLFWSPRPARSTPPRTLEEAGRQVLPVLREAVRQRVEGQQTVLVDLSGGLDSSSCAVLATEELSPARVMGVHFSCQRVPEADERAFARRVARELGLPLRIWTEEEVPLLQEASQFARLAPVPLTAVLFFGSWYRCLGQLARSRRVRMYLRGTFGDALWDPAWRTILRECWQERAFGIVWQNLWLWHRQGMPWGQIVLTRGSPLWRSTESPWHRRPLAPWLRPEVWQRVLEVEEAERQRWRQRGPVQVWEWLRGIDRFAESAALAAARPLVEAGLTSTDPYTDPRVLEQVLAIPLALLVPHGLPPKGLLREAMRGHVPEPVRLRATKGRIARAIFRALWERRAWLQDELRAGSAELAPYVDGDSLRAHLNRLPFLTVAQPLVLSSLALALWVRQGGAAGGGQEPVTGLPAAPVVLRGRGRQTEAGSSGQLIQWME